MELDESLDNEYDDVGFEKEEFEENQMSLSLSTRNQNTMRNFAGNK